MYVGKALTAWSYMYRNVLLIHNYVITQIHIIDSYAVLLELDNV